MKFLAGRASRRSTVKYLAEWGEKKGAINPADRGLCQIFLEINRDDATFHRLNYIWQTGERQRRERSYRKAASRLDFPSADSWQTPDTNGWETNVREYTQRDSDSARGGIEHSFQTICPFPRRMLPFASGSRSSMRWLPLQIEARSKPDFSLSLFPSFHFSTLSLFSQFYPLCQQRERERERERTELATGEKFGDHFAVWPLCYPRSALFPSLFHEPGIFSVPTSRSLPSFFSFLSFFFFSIVASLRTLVWPNGKFVREDSGLVISRNARCFIWSRETEREACFHSMENATGTGNDQPERRETRTECNRRVQGRDYRKLSPDSDRSLPLVYAGLLISRDESAIHLKGIRV